MGFWGTKLYENDCSCDVRDTYLNFLYEGLDDCQAYKKMLETLEDYSDDEIPLFWYSLADTQWEYGRLIPEVKEKALAYIEQGNESILWIDDKLQYQNWQKTLEELKIRLKSPVPPIKEIEMKYDFVHNPWKIGDVYAYRIHSKQYKNSKIMGKYILVHKIGDVDCGDDEQECFESVVCFYNKIFDNLPTINSLDKLKLLPIDNPLRFFTDNPEDREIPLGLYAIMEFFEKTDYCADDFFYVGNVQPKEKVFTYDAHSLFSWFDISDWLPHFYLSWQNYKYDLIDGEYIVSKK